MSYTRPGSLVMPVLACLFAAIISASAYISIPLPGNPVPVVLQNMMIFTTGLVLGPVWGTAAIILYLLLGALGLPVFAGGTGGLARFAGPTGGYIAGYIPCALAAGLVSRIGAPRFWKYASAALLGMMVVYACGLPWLKTTLKADWLKTLATGFFPFIIWDTVKALLAAVLAWRIAPRISALDSGVYGR